MLDDITELDEFSGHPWDSDQVDGQVVFEGLQQTAGRRAILRDREAFPLFIDAVKAIEPAVAHTVERVAKELDAQTADRMSDVIRRIFGRVLKELADLDNPMRAPGGSERGEGGIFEPAHQEAADRSPGREQDESPPDLGELLPSRVTQCPPKRMTISAKPDRSGSSRLPTVAPDPTPGEAGVGLILIWGLCSSTTCMVTI